MIKGVQQIKCKQGMYVCCILGLGFATPQVFAGSPSGYVLEVQLTPAACLLDKSKVKKRKCLEGYTLNIQGLYPETDRKDCTTDSSATLPPLQAKVVARVMPDEAARRHLWRSVGACTGTTASQYFRTVINFADSLNIPSVMTEQETKQIHTLALQSMLVRLNKDLTNKAMRFECMTYQKTTYLTAMNICYTQNGRYKACSAKVVSNCPSTFTIKGSY